MSEAIELPRIHPARVNKPGCAFMSSRPLAHGRAKLCDQALRKLTNLRTFDIAQKGTVAAAPSVQRIAGRASRLASPVAIVTSDYTLGAGP